MDYRIWIEGGDWTKFKESELREIDQAVEWGKKYGIHVNINFHRAPGYTVAKPAEKMNVFKDEEALRVCAMHWAAFAKRYKGVPSSQLSFNLFNEPANVAASDYARVVKHLCDAIRAEDPDRLIVCDGLEWGRLPVPELVSLKVAQATRGYEPMSVSHYKASWVGGSDKYIPQWPILVVPTYFYGPAKKDLSSTLPIRSAWKKGDKLQLHVHVVSGDLDFSVKMDGREIWKKEFRQGAGEGEWKKVVYKPEWKIYQNEYDRSYDIDLPEGELLEMGVTKGDWLTLSRLTIIRDGKEYSLNGNGEWGVKYETMDFQPDQKPAFGGIKSIGKSDLQKKWIEPWKKVEAQGLGVMVGEFGAHNQTPHDVVLAWMKDCLENWREAGWGWALWNFRGSFGILDSGRSDVAYEEIEGHKLDRRMLELLQQY